MSPSYDTAPFLLHQICTSMCVQVGAFFLAIHSLVSIFIYGYVPAKLIFGTKNKAYPKLPIPFNDSLRISLYFLHFIYSLVATFDIKTTHSAVRCYRITIALRQLSHKVFVINDRSTPLSLKRLLQRGTSLGTYLLVEQLLVYNQDSS